MNEANGVVVFYITCYKLSSATVHGLTMTPLFKYTWCISWICINSTFIDSQLQQRCVTVTASRPVVMIFHHH